MSIINKFKNIKYQKVMKKWKILLSKKFKLQSQQIFLPDILSSNYSPWNIDNNIRGILLYHQIGAGKTCTAISIAEKLKKLNIIIILPAALTDNFLTELRSECTGNEYITIDERNKLKI